MTNVKIEDVLSSIRRLVSEGADDTPPQMQSKRYDRLVLTPAHRVDVNDDQTSTSTVRLLSQDVDMPLQLRPVDRTDDDKDFSESKGSDTPDLLAMIAELEAAVLDQSDDWEDDGTGTDLHKSWASAGFDGDAQVEDAIEVTDDAASVSSDKWPDTLAEAQRLFGHETSETDDPVFRHRGAVDPTEVDDADLQDDEAYHDDLIEDPDDFTNDEAAILKLYLDGGGGVTRDALQTIVREIVREELQGRMGEKITHNVRKLVRRELHRALSSSDFD